MKLKEFKKLPIIGILRGIKSSGIEELTKTIISSGLKTVEITMNTPSAARLIKKVNSIAGKRLTVGAGTVLTTRDLGSALDAGATFIVMPTLVKDVVDFCVKKSIPVFPGAMTPQEIQNAWNAGATMVKVFPSKSLGPGYIREIKAPFQNIQLLACGGVNNDNIVKYISSGASGIAIGDSIFKKEWIERKEFHYIEEAIKELIGSFKKARPSKS